MNCASVLPIGGDLEFSPAEFDGQNRHQTTEWGWAALKPGSILPNVFDGEAMHRAVRTVFFGILGIAAVLIASSVIHKGFGAISGRRPEPARGKCPAEGTPHPQARRCRGLPRRGGGRTGSKALRELVAHCAAGIGEPRGYRHRLLQMQIQRSRSIHDQTGNGDAVALGFGRFQRSAAERICAPSSTRSSRIAPGNTACGPDGEKGYQFGTSATPTRAKNCPYHISAPSGLRPTCGFDPKAGRTPC